MIKFLRFQVYDQDFGDNDKEKQIIALENNVVIGTVTLSNLDRRACCITRLHVSEHKRRKGIGKLLIVKCFDVAFAIGCETVGLLLTADNIELESFYKKCGFSFAYQYDDGDFLLTKTLG